MFNRKANGIKKLNSMLFEKKVLKIEKDYAAEFSKILGADPKRGNGSEDVFNHYGKTEEFISALRTGEYGGLFTAKQWSTVQRLRNDGFKRLNILDGSVRAGKTYISLVIWALWITKRDYSDKFIMVGRTLSTLQRNCLEPLQELFGDKNFSYSIPRKRAELFGRCIYLEGADNAQSESKIRGMTLAGAYCDEITLLDETFFRMLLSRLSMPGAFMLGTTNPDNPTHWLNKNYFERADELSLFRETYLIDDNTFLDREYIQNIKQEYVGVFYERFILSLWKAAEGVVYPLFANNPNRYIIDSIGDDDIVMASIGVDFGGNGSAHAFVLNGFTKGFREVVTLDEFYLKKEIDAETLEKEFIRFAKRALERYNVYVAYCDSAESTLIKSLVRAVIKEKLPLQVDKARKGPIIDRIRFFNVLMAKGRYKVLRSCDNIIKAYSTVEWSPKPKDGKDTRRDDGTFNIDSLDACEYATEAYTASVLNALLM